MAGVQGDLLLDHAERLLQVGHLLLHSGLVPAQDVEAFGLGARPLAHEPPLMPEYDRTPAGDTRRALADGTFRLDNDPEKIIRAGDRPGGRR
ncbi:MULTISPECIES: hypothetical protein [unclassified Nonomuraea]|uniref:hypothetical protein n=1 Tax=unclassified Nonomuraea TaxID=2593643 RepID=UPI00191BEE18|nr:MULTISPECIES: hypothetical protein [unclassified Nonomuraea]